MFAVGKGGLLLAHPAGQTVDRVQRHCRQRRRLGLSVGNNRVECLLGQSLQKVNFPVVLDPRLEDIEQVLDVRIGHRTDEILRGWAEGPQGLQDFFAVLDGPTVADQDGGREVAILASQDTSGSTQLVRGRTRVIPIEAQDVFGLGKGI